MTIRLPVKCVRTRDGLWNIRTADGHRIAVDLSEQEAADMASALNSYSAMLSACRTAKKYLEPDLKEPGRTVFWRLVDAIKMAENQSPAVNQRYPAGDREHAPEPVSTNLAGERNVEV